jgi:hypothetical protein
MTDDLEFDEGLEDEEPPIAETTEDSDIEDGEPTFVAEESPPNDEVPTDIPPDIT